MTEKFCRDCVHLRQSGVMRNCVSPKLGKNLVTGEDERWPADILRKQHTIRLPHDEAECCGPDGKWFEALATKGDGT